MKNCLYYQAQVEKKDCWFFVATLRSFEHLCFDRTYDKETSIFEFFVPEDQDTRFREIMAYYMEEDIVTDFIALPNRLLDPRAEF